MKVTENLGNELFPGEKEGSTSKRLGLSQEAKNKKQKTTGDRKDKMSKESRSRKVKKVAVITEETRRGRGSWQEQSIQ